MTCRPTVIVTVFGLTGTDRQRYNDKFKSFRPIGIDKNSVLTIKELSGQ